MIKLPAYQSSHCSTEYIILSIFCSYISREDKLLRDSFVTQRWRIDYAEAGGLLDGKSCKTNLNECVWKHTGKHVCLRQEVRQDLHLLSSSGTNRFFFSWKDFRVLAPAVVSAPDHESRKGCIFLPPPLCGHHPGDPWSSSTCFEPSSCFCSWSAGLERPARSREPIRDGVPAAPSLCLTSLPNTQVKVWCLRDTRSFSCSFARHTRHFMAYSIPQMQMQTTQYYLLFILPVHLMGTKGQKMLFLGTPHPYSSHLLSA